MSPFPRDRILLALILLAGALAYANGLTGDFIWDDRNLVLDNVRTHGLSHLPELLGFGTSRFGFRAVRDLSYALDFSVAGLKPVVYHVSNLLYHLLCTGLLWALARRLGLSVAAACWAGLLFAVHPAHVDAVTYISGRRDLLSTAFYLGGVLAFARYRDAGRAGWFALAAACGVLGTLAKEMTATLPLAWVLYDAWRLADGGRITAGARAALRRHWLLYGGGGLAAAGLVAYAVLVQGLTHGAGPVGGSWGVHAMSEVPVLAYALKVLLFPVTLLIDYQHVFPPVTSPADPRFLGAALLLVGLIGAAWAAFARRRTPAFAAHWVWITYLPVMQIVPHPERFAEHYLYLPSAGAALLAGMGIARLAERPAARRAVLTLGAAVVLLFALRTADRNRDFADEVTVFEAALKAHPKSPRVWNELAVAYVENGRRADAVALLRRAMGQTRDPLLTTKLARLLHEDGRENEALAWLLDAYARYPGDPRILAGLGDAFYALGRYPDARRAWQELASARPGSVEAELGLANVARARGRLAEAAEHYLAVTRRAPNRKAGWTGLGLVRQGQGDRDGARDAFRKVLALDPEDGDAWNNLGVLALAAGDRSTAEGHFERALAGADAPPTAYLNLARLRLERADCAGARQALAAAAARDVVLPPGPVRALAARAAAVCGPPPPPPPPSAAAP